MPANKNDSMLKCDKDPISPTTTASLEAAAELQQELAVRKNEGLDNVEKAMELGCFWTVFQKVGEPKTAKTFLSRGQSLRTVNKGDLPWLQWLVASSEFQVAIGLFIMLNSAMLAFQCQHSGLIMGHATGFESEAPGDAPKTQDMEAFEDMEKHYDVLEMCFGIVFSIELVLNLAAARHHFFFTAMNCFVALLVGSWIFGLFVDLQTGNPLMLRMFSLIKLAKLLRLIKAVSKVHKLMHMV